MSKTASRWLFVILNLIFRNYLIFGYCYLILLKKHPLFHLSLKGEQEKENGRLE